MGVPWFSRQFIVDEPVPLDQKSACDIMRFYFSLFRFGYVRVGSKVLLIRVRVSFSFHGTSEGRWVSRGYRHPAYPELWRLIQCCTLAHKYTTYMYGCTMYTVR
jgi:hypothetical protein